jgi:hypothetical protein
MTVEAAAALQNMAALMSTVDVRNKIPGVFSYCSAQLTRL